MFTFCPAGHMQCNVPVAIMHLLNRYILRLVTVIVEEDQINTPTCSPGAFIRHVERLFGGFLIEICFYYSHKIMLNTTLLLMQRVESNPGPATPSPHSPHSLFNLSGHVTVMGSVTETWTCEMNSEPPLRVFNLQLVISVNSFIELGRALSPYLALVLVLEIVYWVKYIRCVTVKK